MELSKTISLLKCFCKKITSFLFLDKFEKYLFFISFSISLMIFIFLPVHYNGDSEQSLKIAWYLLGDDRGEYFYYRTNGLPIMFILTGIATFMNFSGLKLLQAFLASLIPLIIYRTFHPFDRKLAKISAAVILVSLLPFNVSNYMTTDFFAIFFQFLSLNFFSLYIYTHKNIYIILIAITTVIMGLFRPAAGLILLPFLISFFIIKPIPWKHILLFSVVFFSLTFTDAFARSSILSSLNTPIPMEKIAFGSGMSGNIIFLNAYTTARQFCNDCLVVSEGNGPNTKLLIEEIHQYINEHPDFLAYKPEIKSKDKFIKELFTKTTLINHALIWTAAERRLGPDRYNQLMLNVWWEAIKTHPQTTYYLFDLMTRFFFGYGMIYSPTSNVYPVFIPTLEFTPLPIIGPEPMLEPQWYTLKSNYTSPAMVDQQHGIVNTKLYDLYVFKSAYQFILKVISVISMLVFFPFLWGKKISKIFFLFILLILYQCVTVISFAIPSERYIYPAVPLILLLAVSAVYYFWSREQEKNKRVPQQNF